MNRFIDIICPVSAGKADEYITRTIAVFTVLVTIAALFFGNYLIMLLLTADFAIRSFTSGKGSPLKFISIHTAGFLEIRDRKLIDAAPKKFAALLGMTFSFLTAVFMIMQFPITAVVIASALIFCALLEGIFGYCLGCVVYSILVSPRRKNL
jgi:hypothetical protein